MVLTETSGSLRGSAHLELPFHCFISLKITITAGKLTTHFHQGYEPDNKELSYPWRRSKPPALKTLTIPQTPPPHGFASIGAAPSLPLCLLRLRRLDRCAFVQDLPFRRRRRRYKEKY